MLVNFAQGIEDGFALLEAFDYGPYPVVDKVLIGGGHNHDFSNYKWKSLSL